MALIPCNRFAGSYNFTFTQPFKTANTTNWLTFCVGPVPSDQQLSDLTSVNNTIITNATVGTIASNAGSSWMYNSATTTPPLYYANVLPTTKTFTSTGTGTLTHAVVNSGGFFIVVDVGVLNSGAVIQVDTTAVDVGTVVTLQQIQFKMWS